MNVRVDIPEELVEAIAVAVADRLVGDGHGGSASPADEWRLLNVEAAAARLGRSTRWVRERVKDGSLATVRLDGGPLAFDVEDLRAFAAERRMGGRELAWR